MYGKDTWVNAQSMRAQGMSYVEIAKTLGKNRRTAKKQDSGNCLFLKSKTNARLFAPNLQCI